VSLECAYYALTANSVPASAALLCGLRLSTGPFLCPTLGSGADHRSDFLYLMGTQAIGDECIERRPLVPFSYCWQHTLSTNFP